MLKLHWAEDSAIVEPFAGWARLGGEAGRCRRRLASHAAPAARPLRATFAFTFAAMPGGRAPRRRYFQGRCGCDLAWPAIVTVRRGGGSIGRRLDPKQ